MLQFLISNFVTAIINFLMIFITSATTFVSNYKNISTIFVFSNISVNWWSPVDEQPVTRALATYLRFIVISHSNVLKIFHFIQFHLNIYLIRNNII